MGAQKSDSSLEFSWLKKIIYLNLFLAKYCTFQWEEECGTCLWKALECETGSSTKSPGQLEDQQWFSLGANTQINIYKCSHLGKLQVCLLPFLLDVHWFSNQLSKNKQQRMPIIFVFWTVFWKFDGMIKPTFLSTMKMFVKDWNIWLKKCLLL